MRKRLIGKAFAVAMSGAMVFTASPVAANIFNVPAIVKAAEADQAEEYVYCYAGLTWEEYWGAEDVYEAKNTSSSSEVDAKGEYDKGGFDVVTRATKNHGLHRGSFQCNTVIHATDDKTGATKDFAVSHWTDRNTLILTDGTSVNYDNGTITVGEGDNASTYTQTNYNIYGLKYVPVKVAKADYDAFAKKYTVVENGKTIQGGFGENRLSSYSETANVTENTNGLKTVSKDADGNFVFSARSDKGTESGIKDVALKTAADITTEVKPASGSFGEFLRVDLTTPYTDKDGNAAMGTPGDLGANMQAVKWTYYGNDSSRTKEVRSFGTKFAADNWMHGKMSIQLGLTDSVRCQIPDGYDGTGYWSLTVYALGYKDFTTNFEVTADNIVKEATPATDAEKAALQKLVNEAKALNEKDYCKSDAKTAAFATLKAETEETVDLLAKEGVTSAEIEEQTTHLTDAIKTVKSLKKHSITTTSTLDKSKKSVTTVQKCKNCGTVIKTTKTTAPAKTTAKLSSAKKTSLKVSWKKVSGASAYQIQYATASSFKGAKTVKVSSKSASKTLTKLKKNKKYYVRVRSYKTVKVNNKSVNLYSDWSAKKSLKTKKK